VWQIEAAKIVSSDANNQPCRLERSMADCRVSNCTKSAIQVGPYRNFPPVSPDWIFEPKLDGFRALAYVEGGVCRLVSRNRNAFKTFEPLEKAIGQELSGRSAILDGEIVRPGPDGRPMFYAI
jgi:ATP-dependent DNA ligase